MERVAAGGEPEATALLPPLPKVGDELWLSLRFRLATAAGAALGYPLLLYIFAPLADMERASGVTVLSSSFSPALSILFGTLLSLTVSIQYGRLQKIQDVAASESADIAYVARVLLGLLSAPEHAPRRAVVVAALADQVTTLTGRSRQEELVRMMQRDPYGQLSEALDDARNVRALAADARLERGSALVGTLMQARSARLSAASTARPRHVHATSTARPRHVHSTLQARCSAARTAPLRSGTPPRAA